MHAPSESYLDLRLIETVCIKFVGPGRLLKTIYSQANRNFTPLFSNQRRICRPTFEAVNL